MYQLNNTIKDYAWGSTTLISDFLGTPASGTPEAEMWLGAHPGAPSTTRQGGHDVPLDALIAADPERTLGSQCRTTFGGRLPFLMKILAAGAPLSLQVHPSTKQAAAGFAAEEAAGVPLGAPHRNYKDAHHKPEMILALTPFEALCGFRESAEAASIFRQLTSALQANGEVPAILTQVGNILDRDDQATGISAAFELLIRGGSAVAEAIKATSELLRHQNPDMPLSPELATARSLGDAYPGDSGALISLMLNRVSLAPGEAVYLPAGNIHAYLNGLGIEVMASSDNVLRGGLTEKHVDLDELMRTVDFTPLPVPYLQASSPADGREIWQPPFEEFQLQRIEHHGDSGPAFLVTGAPAILLVASGTARVSSTRQSFDMRRGHSAFISAGETSLSLQSLDKEPVVVFLATVAATAAVPA